VGETLTRRPVDNSTTPLIGNAFPSAPPVPVASYSARRRSFSSRNRSFSSRTAARFFAFFFAFFFAPDFPFFLPDCFFGPPGCASASSSDAPESSSFSLRVHRRHRVGLRRGHLRRGRRARRGPRARRGRVAVPVVVVAVVVAEERERVRDADARRRFHFFLRCCDDALSRGLSVRRSRPRRPRRVRRGRGVDLRLLREDPLHRGLVNLFPGQRVQPVLRFSVRGRDLDPVRLRPRVEMVGRRRRQLVVVRVEMTRGGIGARARGGAAVRGRRRVRARATARDGRRIVCVIEEGVGMGVGKAGEVEGWASG
jgi:hypothetical protein